MAVLLYLLPFLVQGVWTQLFRVEPQPRYVVKQGDSVTLECVANQPVATRTWKVYDAELGVDGFILNPIPENLNIKARDPESKTDCSITLNNVDMRYDGSYVCSPFTMKGGQEDARKAHVIVAQKPVSLEFDEKMAGRIELTADVDRKATITCEAREARPAAKISWYLGTTQLYDGIKEERLNASSGGARALITTKSTLTYQFNEDQNGGMLRCVASHAGYEESDVREASVVVNVQYAPYRSKGNNVGTMYGFTEGQEGRIIINFTANPEPYMMVWKVGENLSVPTGGQSLDGRFTANTIQTLDKENDTYALSLLINPIRLEDQLTEFALELENSVGRNVLKFNLGTGPAPPPEGLSTGALSGIIVLVLLLLIIIVLVAFARSRGKWCFAAPAISKRPESRTTIDPELAISSSSKSRHHPPGHDNPAVDPATTPPPVTATNGAAKNGKAPTDTPV